MPHNKSVSKLLFLNRLHDLGRLLTLWRYVYLKNCLFEGEYKRRRNREREREKRVGEKKIFDLVYPTKDRENCCYAGLFPKWSQESRVGQSTARSLVCWQAVLPPGHEKSPNTYVVSPCLLKYICVELAQKQSSLGLCLFSNIECQHCMWQLRMLHHNAGCNPQTEKSKYSQQYF